MDRRHIKRALLSATVCAATVCAMLGSYTDSVAAEQSVEQQYLKCARKMRQEQADNRAGVEKAILERQALDAEDIETVGQEPPEGMSVMSGAFVMGKEQYDMEQAYQVNNLELFLVTEADEKGFESCITDEVFWMVPYDTEFGVYGLAEFGRDKDNGGFKWYSQSMCDEPGNEEAIPPADEVIAKNFQEAVPDEDVQKIQYTYAGMYATTLIYVKTDQNEYIIPYAENEKMFQMRNKKSELRNGDVYKMNKFIKEMKRISDEEDMMEGDPDLTYGGFYRGDSGIEPWMVIVAVVILLAIAAGVVVAVRKKKAKG